GLTAAVFAGNANDLARFNGEEYILQRVNGGERLADALHAKQTLRRHEFLPSEPAGAGAVPRNAGPARLSERILGGVLLGHVDPGLTVDHPPVQLDFVIAVDAEIHAVGDRLALEQHHGDLLHQVTG